MTTSIRYLVCLVLCTTVAAELEDIGGGSLYHNYNGEYASTYDNYEPRDYHFEYGVSDPHTGDHKSQWEVKDKAGVVRGGYSLLEPDGTTRIVEYIADDDGFRAIVKKIGTAIHPGHVEAHGFSTQHQPAAAAPELVLPSSISEPAHIEQPNIITATPETYHAYDGHAENYANVLNGAAVQHFTPIELPQHSQQVHDGFHEAIYVPEQEEVLAPKAQGIYYDAEPKLQLVGQYGQNVLSPEAQGIYRIPQQQNVAVQQEYAAIPQQYYQTPVNVAHPHGVPSSQYHAETTGNPEHQAYADIHQQEQQYYHEPESVAHPYRVSSNQFHGTTGNPDDDSAYTNYDDHQDGGGGNSDYIPSGSNYVAEDNQRHGKTLPYNFVVSHPILH